MKKIILLLFLTIASIGCSKDDAEFQQIDMTKLQGIWELREMTDSGTIVELSSCELKERYTFSNGYYTHLNYTSLGYGSGDCEIDSKTGYYESSGNDIVLRDETGGEIEMLWRVIELSDKKLILGANMTIGDSFVIRFEYEKLQ